MEESDLDLLFLSVLLLLTVFLSIALRLLALHRPKGDLKRKPVVNGFPKKTLGGNISRMPPSTPTSIRAASGEEENVSAMACESNHRNPGFLGPYESKKPRATSVEVVATRLCFASEMIRNRQIVRDFEEIVTFSKLSVGIGPTLERSRRRIPEPPANTCFGFSEVPEPRAPKHPQLVGSYQHQVLRWIIHVAPGSSSTPLVNWSCNSEHLINVGSGDINFGALTSDSEKIHLLTSEVGVGDDGSTEEIVPTQLKEKHTGQNMVTSTDDIVTGKSNCI